MRRLGRALYRRGHRRRSTNERFALSRDRRPHRLQQIFALGSPVMKLGGYQYVT
jgi:hypothetical protein